MKHKQRDERNQDILVGNGFERMYPVDAQRTFGISARIGSSGRTPCATRAYEREPESEADDALRGAFLDRGIAGDAGLRVIDNGKIVGNGEDLRDLLDADLAADAADRTDLPDDGAGVPRRAGHDDRKILGTN